MLEPRFCYRISEKAGLASDEKGNAAPCYAEMSFEGGNLLKIENYNRIHEMMIDQLARTFNMSIEFIECISQNEYDEETKEEE